MAVHASPQTPTIKLFPTTVLEEIKHTGNVAAEMETGLQTIISRLDEQQRLGATAHHPRYAIAYKFQGDSAQSTLNGVEWSVSRSGAITPVALIEPVIIAFLGIVIGTIVVAMYLPMFSLISQIG